MGLDIRIPLGLVFLIIGTIMATYGVITRGSMIYLISMGVNLNVLWGSTMIAFGTVVFITGRRGRKLRP
jgi:hypothetical protein